MTDVPQVPVTLAKDPVEAAFFDDLAAPVEELATLPEDGSATLLQTVQKLNALITGLQEAGKMRTT